MDQISSYDGRDKEKCTEFWWENTEKEGRTNRLSVWQVDETVSESCPKVGFGISSV
jgi:hypothetical protein